MLRYRSSIVVPNPVPEAELTATLERFGAYPLTGRGLSLLGASPGMKEMR